MMGRRMPTLVVLAGQLSLFDVWTEVTLRSSFSAACKTCMHGLDLRTRRSGKWLEVRIDLDESRRSCTSYRDITRTSHLARRPLTINKPYPLVEQGACLHLARSSRSVPKRIERSTTPFRGRAGRHELVADASFLSSFP